MNLILPSRCLHNSYWGALSWILSLNIFVIVLLILVFWGAFSLDDTTRLALIVLEVVWEPCALSRLMLLLQRSIICFTLPRNSRQLLLRLAHANSLTDESRLSLILWLLVSLSIAVPLCWVTSHKPYLFILVLVMFNRQFGLRCVDLVAFLTYAFGWDIVTLFFAFFAVPSWNLQMPSNKRGSKLILSDGGSQ